jgi:RNA polymerase sigma-70 factor (ECF subfamily)
LGFRYSETLFLYTKTIACGYVSLEAEQMELSVSELWMSQPRADEDPMAKVIALAITGDRAAFGEIVIRHERRVLTLALRLLGTMEDAQDAAQEVFLRTFKYLRRFDPSRPLEPWLVRTTVNVCHGLGRKRQLHRMVFVHADFLNHADPAGNPHAELRAAEQRRMLYRALDVLGEKERTAIVLRDIEEFTTAEVAEILASSEATVRSQISVARLKIRKVLQRLKGDPR